MIQNSNGNDVVERNSSSNYVSFVEKG